MKSIYSRLREGDTFEVSGVQWYVRELWRGKMCIQLCSDNDEDDREVNGGIWVNPADTRFDEEKARILNLAEKTHTPCAACVGVTNINDACDACKANYVLIQQLKNALK